MSRLPTLLPALLLGALLGASLAAPAAAQTAPVKADVKAGTGQTTARGTVTTSTQGLPLVFGALGGAKVAAGVIAPVLLLGTMSNSGSH
jgi:hypothetical protein